mmetsp:Transcript_9483/g.20785  ORF Transcript_9483/g.20785 Transcript_9483/m.20785 type:complete len:1383 (-) Transcript_9483:151-4299(-)
MSFSSSNPKDVADLQNVISTMETFRRTQQLEQDRYSKLKNAREKATFSMMMKMNPAALTNIRKEFFARRDSVTLDEFIYIIQKHLVNRKGDESFVMETPEQREFGTNMYELFKDIDVNGDGQLEWQEFTSFTVEKANLLNKRQKLTSIAHYHDSTHMLDPSAHYRHRHDISKFVEIPSLAQFAIVEDHKNSIFVFNSRLGKHVATIPTESAPVAIESIQEKDKCSLITAGADMTLSTFSLDDANPKRRYKVQTSWATPGVQMALAYAAESRLLYSGGTNGNIYSWNVHERSLVTTLSGHTDIVMNLMVLQKLDNVASVSLDKTVSVWDSHTNERILTLHGHKKGVFDLTYNPQHRLIFSCGFEHDACVWSPFVNSMVFRLKGHHASLVGVQSVEGSHEVITADTAGVFKLWDVRNFQCVQTFSANLSGAETKDSSKLTCFFHSKLASRNPMQEEDDSRIYAASKLLFSFDQARVVHEQTTDYYNCHWMAYIPENSVIITASDRNVIVWDALIGSKIFAHTNICGEEISACCLDDRKRKIILGDIKGKIGVYNCSNGALMKTVHKSYGCAVVSLHYYDLAKRFIAGFGRGQVCIFDENVLEECILIRQFEIYPSYRMDLDTSSTGKYSTREMLATVFSVATHTIATAGASDGVLRLWDYDSSKCVAEIKVCDASVSQIVQTILLLPYPLVLTSDSSGNLVLWGSRGSRYIGQRITGMLNMTPATAEPEPREGHADDDAHAPRRALPPNTKTTTAMQRPPTGQSRQVTPLTEGESEEEFSTEGEAWFVEEDRPITTEDQGVARLASRQQAQTEYDESVQKWGSCSAAYALAWHLPLQLLVTGDDLGNVRCFSLRDALTDMHRESLLLDERHQPPPLGLCREMERDDSSAMVPIDHDVGHYLLAKHFDAMSHLGVRFRWAISAHSDRIISCECTPSGIITSAADRLVRMWTYDGLPIGTLLQSVPIGTRSKGWDLVLDVQSIIARENAELDGIIDQVTALSNNDSKPDITGMDFTGMQLGAESAEFSQSVLRQRIERTTKILGLDFSNADRPADMLDGSSVSPSLSPSLSPSVSPSPSVSVSVSTAHKSLADALGEIKSTDSTVDYESKTRNLSYIQQRRKENKLTNVANIYEAKSGVFLNTATKEVSIWDDEEDETKGTDFDMLLVANNDMGSKNDSAVNDDMYSIELTMQQRARDSTIAEAGKARGRSKLAESIKRAKNVGPRTISMMRSCRKYEHFNALVESIQPSPLRMEPSEAQFAEMRAARERKLKGVGVFFAPSPIRDKRASAKSPKSPPHTKSPTAKSARSPVKRSPKCLSTKSQEFRSIRDGAGTGPASPGALVADAAAQASSLLGVPTSPRWTGDPMESLASMTSPEKTSEMLES